jgi:hypothetical protein
MDTKISIKRNTDYRFLITYSSRLMGILIFFSLTPIFATEDNDRGYEEHVEEKTFEKVAEKAAERAVEKFIDATMEKAAEKAAVKAVEKATEITVERVAEKTAKMAVEKAIQKASEKTLEKVTQEKEQAELKGNRPEELKGPTTVFFLIFIVDIDDIDDAAQTFTANVYLRLRWKDARLANPEGNIRQIPLEEVWNPRVLLANQQGLVPRSLPEIAQVNPDGTVMYHQRYTGKFSQRLMLVEFPMDTHKFTIQFVATGYHADDLTFEPDQLKDMRGGSIAKELSLADWKILTYEVSTAPYKPIKDINSAAFAFIFHAERYVSYYFWQVVLPLAVVVIMSWSAFWVGREHIGVRAAVATSSVLTLIAHRFVLASLLPQLPYMTRLDYFTVGSTLLVLLALITVVMIGFLTAHSREQLAGNIDHWARGVFPACFLMLSSWFFWG